MCSFEHIENIEERVMDIETYFGKGSSAYLNLPPIARPICGIKNDEQAPEEIKGSLILFSGGLDSTFLLYETLKTTNVHLLYVAGNLNRQKVDLELQAREKIKKWFTDNHHGEYRIISDTVLEFHVGDTEQMFNGLRLPQPAMWLFPALYFYKSGLHTDLKIGYVEEDMAIPFLDKLKAAWDQLTQFVKTKSIPLDFPLMNTNKKFIYATLPNDLKRLVWVCEMPLINGNREFIECAKCKPCQRRATYLNN
jgi:7-cyano-7-deazaguanine synthase in queuosine biosynthesis